MSDDGMQNDPKAQVAEAMKAVGLDEPSTDEHHVEEAPGEPVAGVDADLFALHAMGLTTPEEAGQVSQALTSDPDRGLDLAEARASGDIRISQDMPVVRPEVSQPPPAQGQEIVPTQGGASQIGKMEERPLKNQRREQSTLFSLDELDAINEQDDQKPAQPLNEPSGLVNLNALHAAQMAPGPSLVSTPTDTGSGRSPLMLVAVALLLLGAGGAGVFFWLKGQKDPEVQNAGQQVASNTKPAQPVAAKVAEQPAPAPPVTPPPEQPAPTTAAAAVPDAAVPDAAVPDATVQVAKVTRSRSRRRARSTSRTPAKAATAAKPAETAVAAAPPPPPKPAPRPSASDREVDDILDGLDSPNRRSRSRSASKPAADPANDPLLPEKLTKSQILGVVKRGAGKIRGCKSRDPSVSGVAKVKVVIGRNGQISSANLLAGPAKGSPVGDCVLQSVKSLRFPQFRGAPMPVTLPFAL